MNESATLTPRFYSLWAINGPLEQARLQRQMNRLRASGLDGVVFHPRFYPGSPPYLSGRYFEEVSEAILHAKSIGLAFWLYDENGWPSGTVGGQLLRQFPQFAQRWVGLYKQKTDGCLKEFEHGGESWCVAERKGEGVDYLEPDMCRRFIEMTYEGYRDGLLPEAFEYVEAFFCDEPEFGLGHIHHALPPDGAIPWSPRLPRLYRERHGDDLISLLPALFFGLDGHEEVRIRFYELLNDLFCEGFISPLDDWCRVHGKRFTAHVKGEEHPLFQVPMVGSCHPVYRRLSLPGIDALERRPSNDFYPRQVSSAARQFGDGRCMAEAFGGAGWGATPEDLESYLLWLGGHGLTDFVMHLSQYRLDSAAIRDWPPSQPLHLSWSEVYPQVLERVRRELLTNPRPSGDTLVVAPYRAIMADYCPRELMRTNIHDAGTYPATKAGKINDRFLEQIELLHREGIIYDITDERTLEQFAVPAGDGVQLKNCRYKHLILGDGCRVESAALTAGKRPMHHYEGVSMPGAPAADAVGRITIPIRWRLDAPPVNSMLLECASEDGTWFTAEFASDLATPHSLRLIFADDIAEALLNGTSLPLESLEDGTVARVPWDIVLHANALLYRPIKVVERPFAWLEGTFRVATHTQFTNGPCGTVKTEGPFSICTGGTLLATDLIADGFPFLREKLIAVTEVEFPRAVAAFHLDGATADAFRLGVDDLDLGWSWDANGAHHLSVALAAGTHRFRIELIPSSYNAFGPHHYYRGDWFVISPDQMNGVRNFADPPDAPESTHVTAWHFRRLGIPSTLTLPADS